MVDSLRYLKSVGEQVQATFLQNRTLLSFQEYLEQFFAHPRVHARDAATWLRDCMDFYGTETVQRPSGTARRFKLFDRPFDRGPSATHEGEGGNPVVGQEDVQNAIYRVLGTFVRLGHVNKLILLHGPNGSAKSSIIAALQRAMEDYSRKEEGALYRFSWVFPSEKLVKGSIGFGEAQASPGNVQTYAHLEGDQVDARIQCEMKDHPLYLVPRSERQRILKEHTRPDDKFHLAQSLLEGELCHKCRQIYAALLQSNNGDVLKVLRHVQVERFYVSRRYLASAVTVEPQMSVDADYRQVTQDRSHGSLPGTLQNLSLYEPYGPLVASNRGLIEFSDLLKRPLEHYKYLLGTVETGVARMSHFLLHLDCVYVASSNEKHLAAFKEISDWPSFKGRIELVRVPYLRRSAEERQIYDQEISSRSVGKHVAPHATEVAAQWAVLTRLKKPLQDRHKGDLRKLVDRLTPSEKMDLYDTGRPPTRLPSGPAKELRKAIGEIWHESDSWPNYEGRNGASAREIKTLLFNAAQNADYKCLSPQAVLHELGTLVADKSVYEFLQHDVVDGYHDADEFVRLVEARWLDTLDDEVRDALGLVSEKQYRELFERYIQHVVSWVRGEKLLNKVTGDFERPDDDMMASTEAILMSGGEDRREFRRALIGSIGAQKLDHPDEEIDYSQIFPDLFRKLRDHFFDERKRALRKSTEKILRYLGDERGALLQREVAQVEGALVTLRERYGYCPECAKDALVLLLSRRYTD